jgi:NitT/TauT family transport system substrate-binding protein
MRAKLNLFASALVLLALLASGCGNKTEKPRRIRIATYSQGSLTALPLLLAESLGYFSAEGLQVEVEEMPSGAKAIQALVGGSADVASAFYELTVQMALQGRELTSFASLARYPGYVLAVSPGSTKKIHSVGDLKGGMVAISSPGSPTDLFLKYVMIQHGLSPDSASTVAAGSNAARFAILERSGVDAAVLSDPAVTQFLRLHPQTTMLADVRSPAGVKQLYGTETYASAVLTSQAQWLRNSAEEARRLGRAINRSLAWIQGHSPEQITQQTPSGLKGNDPALFAETLRAAIPSFPPDGRFEPAAVNAVFKVLATANPKVNFAKVDAAKTYTNDFVTEK